MAQNEQLPSEKHIGLFDSLRLASPTDRNMSYMLIFLFSAASSIALGVPIMFKDPLIYCIDSSNNTFVCSEQDACSNQFQYYIDKENGPKSFTTEFDLICENSSQKRFALTMNFLGFFVGCFIITFFVISAGIRKKMLSFYACLYGVCLLLMLLFTNSLFIISLLLFVSSFCFICINAYVYVFITENFIGDLASSLMILVNVGWAVAGIFFAIFAFFINSNWKIFLGVAGVLMTFGGVCCWKLSFPKNYGNLQSNKVVGIFESFGNLWSSRQIFVNFLIYALIWPHYILCYTSVLIELESVGGSLYLNLILCSTIEIVAAFMATYLSSFNIGKVVNVLLSILSLCFLLFFLAPISLSSSSITTVLFFIGFMLIGKLCYDIISLMVYIYIPKLLTDKYVPLFLIFSRFLSRFMLLFIPYINFFLRSIDLHPFVFLGAVWLLCRILTPFSKEVQNDGVDNLMSEFKVSMAHKLSVMSGGKSMASIPHDEFLKNIKVKGQNLSVLRKSRFQSGINKNESLAGGLTGTLLKDIIEIKDYKSKYLEEENQ